ESGVFERVTTGEIAEDSMDVVRLRLASGAEGICVRIAEDSELMRSTGVILRAVHSILAIPLYSSNQLIGLWYFERREESPAFSEREMEKVSFFALASRPLIEAAFRSEWQKRSRSQQPQITEDFVGSSKKMIELGRMMLKAAALDVTVLI